MRTFAVAAAALAVIGQPQTVRVSQPSDERAQPQALTEYWELSAVDPRTRRALAIRLQRAEGHPAVSVSVVGVAPNTLHVLPDQAWERDTSFAGPGGRSSATSSAGRVTVDVADAEVRGRIVLRGRPGPFASRWRLGSAVRYPSGRSDAVDVSYNVPIGSGRLSGMLEILGHTIRLDGWRGSWEHVWGSFLHRDENWKFWDAYAVQRRGGGAWITFGLNRADTLLGPGARDAQWLGVLARVGARGTRVCRPTVHRRRWSISADLRDDPVAHRLTARCRGMRVTLTDSGAADWLRDDGYDFVRQQALPATARGGFGIARHQSHLSG